MTTACRLCVTLLALAAITGCGKGKEERAQAAGEILEGTASDAMLKTDLIRSEAPLAPRKAGGGDKAGDTKAKAGPAHDTKDEAPAVETPSSTETPTPAVPASPVPSET